MPVKIELDDESATDLLIFLVTLVNLETEQEITEDLESVETILDDLIDIVSEQLKIEILIDPFYEDEQDDHHEIDPLIVH